MNANELTALISECLRETDDHEFFLKLESVLRQQQAEIEVLKQSKFDGNNKVNFELTQDEILDIWYEMKDSSNDWTRYVEFARAILRKAQEK